MPYFSFNPESPSKKVNQFLGEPSSAGLSKMFISSGCKTEQTWIALLRVSNKYFSRSITKLSTYSPPETTNASLRSPELIPHDSDWNDLQLSFFIRIFSIVESLRLRISAPKIRPSSSLSAATFLYCGASPQRNIGEKSRPLHQDHNPKPGYPKNHEEPGIYRYFPSDGAQSDIGSIQQHLYPAVCPRTVVHLDRIILIVEESIGRKFCACINRQILRILRFTVVRRRVDKLKLNNLGVIIRTSVIKI